MSGMYPRAPLQFERMSPEAQLAASRSFLERIAARRSVRDFSTEGVHPELIENAIRAAASAPSGANQQPWTFVVVQDAAVKKRIREAAEAEEREFYEHRCPPEWLAALAPLGTDWHKPFLETAPVLIAVFRVDYGIVAAEAGKRLKHYYVQESVGIAVGILLTALHLSGLVALTHTPSPMAFLNRILERPGNERPFVLIPVGYPSSEASVPVIRKKTPEEVQVFFLR